MSTVTGPPPEMAECRAELTPMMSQYFELCTDYEDELVLFQVGDFYEAFCDAAEEVSRVCEVTLTQREDSTGTYRMAGIPIDNCAGYVEDLVAAGYRVAVADQVQDPEEATGVVDRAVTRVVTPGTVTDEELLEAGSTNYVACLAARDPGADDLEDGSADDPGTPYGLALVDVTTGEFLATSGTFSTLREELERFAPAEVVAGPGVDRDLEVEFETRVTTHDPDAFERERAESALAEHVNLEPGHLAGTAELRACGGVLAYAEYTQGGADGDLGHVSRLRRYDPDEYVRIDATALRSLEVFESRSQGEGPTLRSVLDETVSAPGRRRLTGWLRQPLVDRDAIEARHGAVAELVERSLVRESIRAAMEDVYDLERLLTRVTRGRADARDLRSLGTTLEAVPDLNEALADAESDRLASLHADLDPCEDLRELIDRAIVADPPAEITEGGLIREGFDERLDELRETEREGREWVADLEARERERTGIDSLAVGYNDVHGYYIEVTNPNLDRVPDDYTRRQTLKNSERFYTPELKRREDEILGASEKADAHEYELFRDVREEVAAAADRLRALSTVLADLDALTALAHVAIQRDYVRPEMDAEGIEIEAGRHPVVETTEDTYVPNDADLTDERFAVITGPNMSGKSTYMRQVALVVLLAQAGSFVPADRARLPVVDGVFTRVGASDDIAGGQSTFMREMAELTTILHAATEESLVLLDEVGRGTSTVDGRSIAWAVTEYLHDRVGATTLFATHYHELTAIADRLEGVCTLHFDAERGEEVTFLYDVREGAASSSYGVEIADMAGIPSPVVERSRELVDGGGPSPATDDGLEANGRDGDAGGQDGVGLEPAGSTNGHARGSGDEHATGDGPPDATGRHADGAGGSAAGTGEGVLESSTHDGELAVRLSELDVARMTPLEAMNELAALQSIVEDGEEDPS